LCYCPSYKISDPTFNQNEVISEIGQDYGERMITATFEIAVKNKSKPLKINLSSANVCLEQRVGWAQRNVRFRLDTHPIIPEIELKPCESWHYQLVISHVCRGNLDSLPDVQKKEKRRWGIWGISVTLPNGGMRPLHKGADCQPERQQLPYII
jgi:hypothetical protein